MSNAFIALFIAAGVSAFIYSKMGRRLGYQNQQNVWTVVGVVFVLAFAVVMILLSTVVTLNN